MVKSDGWLLRLMAVGNQTAQNVDSSVDGRTMPRMLNLRDILQLVKDRLNNGSLTQQQAVIQQHQLLFHVAFEPGNELNARGLEQLFGELLRDITFVREHFAK